MNAFRHHTLMIDDERKPKSENTPEPDSTLRPLEKYVETAVEHKPKPIEEYPKFHCGQLRSLGPPIPQKVLE